MNKKTFLEKLRQVQTILDELFEAYRSLEIAEPTTEPAAKPLVAFRPTNSNDYEVEFNGMIGKIRKDFCNDNGLPIQIDWFDFIRDMQNKGLTPAETRPRIAEQMKTDKIRRRDAAKPTGKPATPPPPPPKKVSQEQLFNARR